MQCSLSAIGSCSPADLMWMAQAFGLAMMPIFVIGVSIVMITIGYKILRK